MNTYHDHGPVFSGPPTGTKCSTEKHRLLREGKEPPRAKAGVVSEEREPYEVSFARLIEFTVVDDGVRCRCCRYLVTE